MVEQADIGLIGLAVMGQNLALNMHDKGFTVAVFNRTVSKVDEMLCGPAKGTKIIGTHSLEELFKRLKRPRRVILMVKAGPVIDQFIEQCLPYMERGDILIDGGNSLYTDTERRCRYLQEKGMLFVGTGISGGEEGARHGPSIMPGGDPTAWPVVKDIFQSIAAKVDNTPCCNWVGEGGAGHYVKMVHNGIEYGDIQLICEVYDICSRGLGLSAEQMHTIFSKWNQGFLDSYLVEISSAIFAFKDADGSPLLDRILDVAGQKGTGKWTVVEALNLGMPLTPIAEAVFARCLSALKSERMIASEVLKAPKLSLEQNKWQIVADLEQALYASKIVSYAQGFMLMREAAKEYKWHLNYGDIALMWRGGCIIRSRFLGQIKEAYDKDPHLLNLLLDPFFREALQSCQQAWRRAVCAAIQLGIPTPCLSTSLAFYDGYRSERLPANLLQALRDYFGAHTYERTDKNRAEYFHTDWAGTGGRISSTTYNA